MTSHAVPKPPAEGHRRSVALFGGTFDPIHSGHIAVAEAAQRRFHLDAIHFIPSSRPPHKMKLALTPFLHRYAMVAVACAEHGNFLPSPAEYEMDGGLPRVSYTIDTVRRFHREHPKDHLYFVIGADQFLELPTWKSYEALLDSCDFIVASRPGFKLDALRLVIPPEKIRGSSGQSPNMIALRKSAIYFLTTVSSYVSSTEIRDRVEKGKSIRGSVPLRVEKYIIGQALYR